MSELSILHEHVDKLCDGFITVREFREWFSEAQWDLEAEGDAATYDYSCQIENRLCELIFGHISETLFQQVICEERR